MTEKKFFINNAEEIIPPVNDSPYKRILAIGDVHATFDKLKSLWKKLSVTDDDLVIFLGDYLYGQGDKNIETLKWLIEHKTRKNIIFLRGNVDDTYLYHLFDLNGNFFNKLNTRVVLGIKDAAVKKPNFPNRIFDFLKNLPLYHYITVGGKKYFLCHAGINIEAPLEAQKKTYLINHPKLKSFYRDYSGDAVIVVGHKSPKKIFDTIPSLFMNSSENLDLTKPIKVPHRNILMLDTHAKENGKLSCVDILTGEIWQSGDGHLSKGAYKMLSKYHVPFGVHISKPFNVQEYNKFKCVIALDEAMLQRAKKISGGDPDKKIRLFTDFDGHKLNIDDPYRTGNYEKTYDEIKLGCSMLLKEIFGK